ncbi:unnamed protein product [Cuscuta campestris]|uniref:Uncharacterized protein n=1 Tax=Cuscuta campestris TaxID=132261 RepID=A0A484KQP2_9ASTE|nr:unnamed protein product [Cuscuta campestris]
MFVKSLTIKEVLIENFPKYFKEWSKAEAGLLMTADDGERWFEGSAYHAIELVLQRVRRVNPFSPPEVDILRMHDPDLNNELGPNLDYMGTPTSDEGLQADGA